MNKNRTNCTANIKAATESEARKLLSDIPSVAVAFEPRASSPLVKLPIVG